MTARMHLALDGAFQREHEPVVDLGRSRPRPTIAAADASLLEAPGVTDLVKWLRESEARLPVIRTHGDFHLGRTARTDQGWVVSDCAPGWRPGPGRLAVRLRSPLGDVADLLWSMHQRQRGRGRGAGPRRQARSRRARPGLGDAEPPGLRDGLPGHGGHRGTGRARRDLVRRLVSFLELARSVRGTAA